MEISLNNHLYSHLMVERILCYNSMIMCKAFRWLKNRISSVFLNASDKDIEINTFHVFRAGKSLDLNISSNCGRRNTRNGLRDPSVSGPAFLPPLTFARVALKIVVPFPSCQPSPRSKVKTPVWRGAICYPHKQLCNRVLLKSLSPFAKLHFNATQGWDVLYSEMLEKTWKEKMEEWGNRPKCKTMTLFSLELDLENR